MKLGQYLLYSTTVLYDELDAETKVTKRFRNLRARGCSILNEARVLQEPEGF